MRGIFNRVELLLGNDVMKRIASCNIIIIGVGGVGSWCAESLVRSGIRYLTIVDSDRVCITNINRQLMATTNTVGMVKVDVLRERLLDINPDADIITMQEIYSDDNNAHFHLDDYDYIIDCIDSLKDKMALLLNAANTKARVFSSMGAALKLDPTQIKVAEYWKVRGCPLGAALRKKMKRAKLKPAKPIMCVYSEELLENKGSNPKCGDADCICAKVKAEAIQKGGNSIDSHDWSASKAQINGTLSHITAIFGFTIAGMVMQDLASTSPMSE